MFACVLTEEAAYVASVSNLVANRPAGCIHMIDHCQFCVNIAPRLRTFTDGAIKSSPTATPGIISFYLSNIVSPFRQTAVAGQ